MILRTAWLLTAADEMRVDYVGPYQRVRLVLPKRAASALEECGEGMRDDDPHVLVGLSIRPQADGSEVIERLVQVPRDGSDIRVLARYSDDGRCVATIESLHDRVRLDEEDGVTTITLTERQSFLLYRAVRDMRRLTVTGLAQRLHVDPARVLSVVDRLVEQEGEEAVLADPQPLFRTRIRVGSEERADLLLTLHGYEQARRALRRA